MKLDEMITSVRDTVSVRRVFAEPIERDGTVLVPAATVGGGGGGGHGHDKDGQEGEGGGFGIGARPAGAYVFKDGDVRWAPAIDVNRIVATIGVVVVAFLVTRARIVKSRAKADAAGS